MFGTGNIPQTSIYAGVVLLILICAYGIIKTAKKYINIQIWLNKPRRWHNDWSRVGKKRTIARYERNKPEFIAVYGHILNRYWKAFGTIGDVTGTI